MNTDDDDDDLVLQCLYDEFTLLEVVIEGDFESVPRRVNALHKHCKHPHPQE
jgi:hypothetical protein